MEGFGWASHPKKKKKSLVDTVECQLALQAELSLSGCVRARLFFCLSTTNTALNIRSSSAGHYHSGRPLTLLHSRLTTNLRAPAQLRHDGGTNIAWGQSGTALHSFFKRSGLAKQTFAVINGQASKSGTLPSSRLIFRPVASAWVFFFGFFFRKAPQRPSLFSGLLPLQLYPRLLPRPAHCLPCGLPRARVFGTGQRCQSV